MCEMRDGTIWRYDIRRAKENELCKYETMMTNEDPMYTIQKKKEKKIH